MPRAPASNGCSQQTRPAPKWAAPIRSLPKSHNHCAEPLVGVVDKAGSGVVSPREEQIIADLCVVGGYAQYAIRPARFLVAVPDGVDAAEAVCIPLAYLTAFQMLTRYRRFSPGETILVIGASGTVGTALLDLARHLGLKAIGTCSAANLAAVERFGAAAIDYRAGDLD